MKNLSSIILTYLLLLTPVLVISQEETVETNPLLEKETELRTDLEVMAESFEDLERRTSKLTGKDLEIFQKEKETLILSAMDLVYELVDNLIAQEEQQLDTTELREFTVRLLDKVPEVIQWSAERYEGEIAAVEKDKETASTSELAILEEQSAAFTRSYDTLYEVGVEYFQQRARVLDDMQEEYADFLDGLAFRTRLIAGRLRSDMAQRNILKNRVSANPEDADLAMRMGALQVSINSGIASLERMVRLKESLDLDVSGYRSLLVESTGDITRGFNLEVLMNLTKQGWAHLVKWAGDSLPSLATKILLFAFVFYIFRLLAKLIQRGVRRALAHRTVKVSRLLSQMITSISYNVVLAFGVLVALGQIGVSLAPLLTGLGVAGVVIGFALQDTLGNFAAGMMILFYRPFDEKDLVEAAGVRGKVSKMSLVSTTILTLDNQTLIVPNGKIWGDVIINVTHQQVRRVDLMIGAGYDADVPHVEKILNEIISSHEKILKDPEPTIKLHELADSSVNFAVRPWAKTVDYWEVYWDIMRAVKVRFDEEGITIPFPQQDVHHYYPEGKPGEPAGEVQA